MPARARAEDLRRADPVPGDVVRVLGRLGELRVHSKGLRDEGCLRRGFKDHRDRIDAFIHDGRAGTHAVRQAHELDLHVTARTADFACTALVAEVQADDPYVPLVFANHMPSWQLQFERERELQTVVTARFLEQLADGFDKHVVLAGDLSADPDAANARFLTGRQSLDGMSVCYRDAWESVHGEEPGETYTKVNALLPDWDWPSTRIDYVFVRCGLHGGPTLEIKSCERIFAEPVDGVWASDHFGVVADLEPPEPPVFD